MNPIGRIWPQCTQILLIQTPINRFQDLSSRIFRAPHPSLGRVSVAQLWAAFKASLVFVFDGCGRLFLSRECIFICTWFNWTFLIHFSFPMLSIAPLILLMKLSIPITTPYRLIQLLKLWEYPLKQLPSILWISY